MKKIIIALMLISLWATLGYSAPYLGDFSEDEVVHFMWSTYDQEGASVTRSTSGSLSVFKDNAASETAIGITDHSDIHYLGATHSPLGIWACTIDTSVHAFYTVGANYTVVVSGSVVDGQSVNAPVAHFSIENRAGTASTNGVTLDWSKVLNPTSSVGLTGTTIATATGVAAIDWANLTNPQAVQALSKTTIASCSEVINGVHVNEIVSSDMVRYEGQDDIYVGINWGSISNATGTAVLSGTTIATSSSVEHLEDTALDDIWDEIITSGEHNVTNSAAYYIRRLYQTVVSSVAQAQSGSSVVIKLANTESSTTDHFKGQTIAVFAGTGAGQARACYGYNGTNKEALIRPAWATAPDNTSWYAILNVGSTVVAAFEDIDLATTMKVSINTEMLDVLATDTHAEPSTTAPPGTPTLVEMNSFLYWTWANKNTTSSTRMQVQKRDGTVLWKSEITDDGVTFHKERWTN